MHLFCCKNLTNFENIDIVFLVKGKLMNKTIGIDQEILAKASEIFRREGRELNEALEEIFRYTIELNKFPIGNGMPETVAPTIRKNTKITKQMCEEIWKTFVDCIVNDSFDFNYRAKVLERDSGVSRGSAFIYLTVIKNMCSGVMNTRNMKIEDLKFFMNKVKEELDGRANENMIASLGESVGYWKEKLPGNYAEKVQNILEDFGGDSVGKLSASEILGN